MTLAYEKLLDKHNLEVSELPKDAQLVIRELVTLKGQVQSKLNIGQKVSPDTYERLRIKDELVVDKIFDYIEENEGSENNDPAGNDDNNNDNDNDMETGVKVDAELNHLFKAGKTEISFEELKSYCPATYDIIFESYENDSTNGVGTSNFELIETETGSEKFKLTKK
jgi:hypothetical protein